MIYDSTTTDLANSVALTTGSYPNLLFEVSIIDAFGNEVGLATDAYLFGSSQLNIFRQGEFKLPTSSSSSSNLLGILGDVEFTYTDCKYILHSLP